MQLSHPSSSSQRPGDTGLAITTRLSTPPSQISSQASSSSDETPRPPKTRSARRTYNEIELSQQFDIDEEMDVCVLDSQC